MDKQQISQEPQAEPKPQAKADEEEINPSDKPRYRKHERPIELDFQEAIDKVDKLFSSDAEVLSAQGKFNELENLNSTTSTILPQLNKRVSENLFNQQEIRFDTLKDFSKWAEFVGVKISPNKRKEAYRYIQSRLKSLEC